MENYFPRRIVKRLKVVPSSLLDWLIDCRLWGWYKIFGSLPRQLSGLLLLPPLPPGDTLPQPPSPGPGLLWVITLWQDFSPLVRMKLVHVSLMVGGGQCVDCQVFKCCHHHVYTEDCRTGPDWWRVWFRDPLLPGYTCSPVSHLTPVPWHIDL